jgi:hypothetical protein
MAKDKISDYSSTANSNTDIAGINIDEGCAPSGINDAIRTLMAQLKTWQSGGQDVYIHPAGSASAPSITANGDTNTGIFFPAADTVGISTGGTERARVDSSGNLGLGVTPSAWASGYVAVENKSGAMYAPNLSQLTLVQNAYYNGSNFIYRSASSQNASRYQQNNGEHTWHVSGAGTAGNTITFTQAMTLDASGNLGLGTTSPTSYGSNYAVFEVAGSTSGVINVKTGSTLYGQLSNGTNSFKVDAVGASSSLLFLTNTTERARIDSSGNLLVGKTSTDASVQGTLFGGGVYLFGTRSGDPYLNANRTSSDGKIANWYRQGTEVGSVSVTTTTTTYNTSSDYRLKDISGPVTGAKDFIMALQPKQGTWKANGSPFVGFLAHEFQEVSPSSVVGEKDAVDNDGNPVYQAMQASSPEVMANLIALVQEQQAIITQLQADVAALKGQA